MRQSKVVDALAKRMVSNCGRWCEITMKRTGEVITIVRTGYGPMERPESDTQEVHVGNEVIPFKDLYDVATWICERA